MTLLYLIFGLIFGSFANVVIYRLPEGMSIIKPRSHCPACGSEISWKDNIPVISWLMLRGKCRNCGKPISARYPLVEIISGILFAVSWLHTRDHLNALVLILFFYYLLLISFIDLDKFIIPNKLTYPFAGLSLLLILIGVIAGRKIVPVVPSQSFSSGILAALASFTFFLILDLAGRLIYKKESIGAGDMKLSFIIGIYLGWIAFVAYLLAILASALIGLIAKAKFGREYLPLGPFLALGAVISVFYGERILNWYLSLII